MKARCVVYSCNNQGMHSIPENPDLRAEWIRVLRLEDASKITGRLCKKYMYVCSDHFKSSDFVSLITRSENDPGIKRLKRNSVPSIFPWKSAEDALEGTRKEIHPKPVTKTYSRVKSSPHLGGQTTKIAAKPVVYSWESNAVVPCVEEECNEEESDVKMFLSSDVHLSGDSEDLQSIYEGYHCNICSAEIVGFRYVCVQCSDFDLCGGCEGRSVHAAHYVLRVPAPRPHSEVQAVLQIIRRALITDAIVLIPGAETDDSVLTKIKTEPVDPIGVDHSSPALDCRTEDEYEYTLSDVCVADSSAEGFGFEAEEVGLEADEVEMKAVRVKQPPACGDPPPSSGARGPTIKREWNPHRPVRERRGAKAYNARTELSHIHKNRTRVPELVASLPKRNIVSIASELPDSVKKKIIVVVKKPPQKT